MIKYHTWTNISVTPRKAMTDSLEQRYQTLCQRLDRAAEAADRPRPRLLAVSKKHSAAAIRRLYALGQREFGESYWQEAEAKMAELQATGSCTAPHCCCPAYHAGTKFLHCTCALEG